MPGLREDIAVICDAVKKLAGDGPEKKRAGSVPEDKVCEAGWRARFVFEIKLVGTGTGTKIWHGSQ